MRDFNWHLPETRETTVDAERLAAIDRAIKSCDEGRSIPLEEVRKLIPVWIAKFKSQPKP
jgi:predicted transcriptional regulator